MKEEEFVSSFTSCPLLGNQGQMPCTSCRRTLVHLFQTQGLIVWELRVGSRGKKQQEEEEELVLSEVG